MKGILPSKESSWRFPDPQTFVLSMGDTSLWLWIKPPHPEMTVSCDMAKRGKYQTGFQELLRAKASGSLISAAQKKLDRVVVLSFSAETGFVPIPPVQLVVELTGRNCNLVLIDENRTILGVARDVDIDKNRFRQLGRGIRYAFPPPYKKLNPIHSSSQELTEALSGKSLKHVKSIVDGIGPNLTEVLGRVVGISTIDELKEDSLKKVVSYLKILAKNPTDIINQVIEMPKLSIRRESERHHRARQKVEKEQLKRLTVIERRLSDIDRARKAVKVGGQIKQEADLLMAYTQTIPEGANSVTLIDFEGEERTFLIDARISPVENAQIRYASVKRRRDRLAQAQRLEQDLQKERESIKEFLENLDVLPVEALEAELEGFQNRVTIYRKQSPGLAFVSPRGLNILVGRNATENDAITFKLGKSLDIWLHVQGYRGSHVLIQAKNKEVPFDTILIAASLAAGYSQARNSENVAVDYALRKNVWRVKGMPKGSVHFSHQKTVYVNPIRKLSDRDNL